MRSRKNRSLTIYRRTQINTAKIRRINDKLRYYFVNTSVSFSALWWFPVSFAALCRGSLIV